MTDFNFASLILGLTSICIGTAPTAVSFIKNEMKEKQNTGTNQEKKVVTPETTISANVEPQIKYSSKPVQEKVKTPISPISFVKETSALQE